MKECSSFLMASSSTAVALHDLLLFIFIFIFIFILLVARTAAAVSSMEAQVWSVCRSTPLPYACSQALLATNFTNPSSSTDADDPLLGLALRSITAAISDASVLSATLSSPATRLGIVEGQRSTLYDCQELQALTYTYLCNAAQILRSTPNPEDDLVLGIRAHLSAALTNKATCLDGLSTSSGLSKPALLRSIDAAYAHVTNSLSFVSRAASSSGCNCDPSRLPVGQRMPEQDDDEEGGDEEVVVTVSQDGSGNFTTIGEAIASAPNNSNERTIIYVREGVYEEHVEIPSHKTNIVLLGDGINVTVITGNRSVGDGWTTFRSATVGVSGQGFLARDITFENSAGPGKGQAVALRVSADLAAVYRCAVEGYQDTLYVHSLRQFYRECRVLGTVDFLFGNAAAIFQGCDLIARRPLPGQSNVVTAQSRDDPNQDTGISIQNCSILPSDDLLDASPNQTVNTYLGRPWRLYSRVVYLESYLDGIVHPSGWTRWSGRVGEEGLDTLYYGEYANAGPGSSTEGRVTWPGYHLMEYGDALNFTVPRFIDGDDWLDSTSFPYDDVI